MGCTSIRNNVGRGCSDFHPRRIDHGFEERRAHIASISMVRWREREWATG